MRRDKNPGQNPGNKGAVILMVAVSMVVLLALGSLAVDVGYIVVIRNQLQNAADAGALAGAQVLYLPDGTVNPGTNTVGLSVAVSNESQGEPVEVDAADVERGHWSFLNEEFTPNDSLAPVSLWGVSTEELDQNTDFINAVRVTARREDTPALSFLSRVIGYDGFEMQAQAVAYRGFAGTLYPAEADQPIAICRQAILDDGVYVCNTGRMINSGGGTTNNTGGWTNFSQPCETASASTTRPLVCASGNPEGLGYGEGMGTVGGMQDNVYRDMRDCWIASAGNLDLDGRPTVPWNLTLPVIDCPSNNVSPCSPLIGAVNVNVVWVKESSSDPQWTDVPLRMSAPGFADFRCSAVTAVAEAGDPTDPLYPNYDAVRIADLTAEQRQACFSEFTGHFGLKTWDGTDAGTLSPSDLQKTMFFLPDCTPHEPAGVTGGVNFGILARTPVLVH